MNKNNKIEPIIILMHLFCMISVLCTWPLCFYLKNNGIKRLLGIGDSVLYTNNSLFPSKGKKMENKMIVRQSDDFKKLKAIELFVWRNLAQSLWCFLYSSDGI